MEPRIAKNRIKLPPLDNPLHIQQKHNILILLLTNVNILIILGFHYRESPCADRTAPTKIINKNTINGLEIQEVDECSKK